jgi:predicted deacylase
MNTATLQVSEMSSAKLVGEEFSYSEGDHMIGAFVGQSDGPTLIAVGSLHGNEPAGSLALSRIAGHLKDLEAKLKGRVYLIAGNTRAIGQRKRFLSS